MEHKQSRVLMSTDAVGGVWTYALQLARGLTRFGFEVELAVLGPAPSSGQMKDAAGVNGLHTTITGLPLDWIASTPAEIADVARLLRARAVAIGADIVHLNAPAHAGREAWPLPLVVSAHSCVATWWKALNETPPPPDLEWRKRCTAEGLAVADVIVAPSGSFAREIADMYGAGPPIIVVHNASDVELTGEAGVRDLVLTAGRLWDPAKDVAAIGRAAQIAELPVTAVGPLAGPNGATISLPSLQTTGTLDHSDLQTLLTRTALFVSMSRYEPFGLSVLEAAQSGAALVLTDIPTFRELWSGAAQFVPQGDAEALAKAMRRLHRDHRARADFAAAARRRAERFSPERMLKGTLRAYGQAIRAAAPRSEPVA